MIDFVRFLVVCIVLHSTTATADTSFVANHTENSPVTTLQPPEVSYNPQKAIDQIWLYMFCAIILLTIILGAITYKLLRNSGHYRNVGKAGREALEVSHRLQDIYQQIKHFQSTSHANLVKEYDSRQQLLREALEQLRAAQNGVGDNVNNNVQLKTAEIIQENTGKIIKLLFDKSSQAIQQMESVQHNCIAKLQENTNKFNRIIKSNNDKLINTIREQASTGAAEIKSHQKLLQTEVGRCKNDLRQDAANLSQLIKTGFQTELDNVKTELDKITNQTERMSDECRQTECRPEGVSEKKTAGVSSGSVAARILATATSAPPEQLSDDNCPVPRAPVKQLHQKINSANNIKDYELTCKLCEEIINVDPNDYKALCCWGDALARQAYDMEGIMSRKSLITAARKYEKATTLKPDYSEALNNWGIVLKNQAHSRQPAKAEALLNEACDKFERSVNAKPNNHEAFSNWGNALLAKARLKKPEQSVETLKKAAQKYRQALIIKPEKANTLHNWGNALLRMANATTSKNRRDLLIQAREKCQKADSFHPGISAKELMCVKSILTESQLIQESCAIGQI